MRRGRVQRARFRGAARHGGAVDRHERPVLAAAAASKPVVVRSAARLPSALRPVVQLVQQHLEISDDRGGIELVHRLQLRRSTRAVSCMRPPGTAPCSPDAAENCHQVVNAGVLGRVSPTHGSDRAGVRASSTGRHRSSAPAPVGRTVGGLRRLRNRHGFFCRARSSIARRIFTAASFWIASNIHAGSRPPASVRMVYVTAVPPSGPGARDHRARLVRRRT